MITANCTSPPLLASCLSPSAHNPNIHRADQTLSVFVRSLHSTTGRREPTWKNLLTLVTVVVQLTSPCLIANMRFRSLEVLLAPAGEFIAASAIFPYELANSSN